MNNLDTIVIVVITVFAFIGLKRGFIKTCFSFVPSIVALFITGRIYPVFSKFLRKTPVYDYIVRGISKAFDLGEQTTDLSSSEIIENLSLPEFFKRSLAENNNTVIYEILDVSEVNEYIAEFIANIFLNIFSFIVIALIIVALFKMVFVMLDIISKLPVIHGINSFAGMAVGAVEGVFVLWVAFVIAVFFINGQKLNAFYSSLENSAIAMPLFNLNIILKMILRIIA